MERHPLIKLLVGCFAFAVVIGMASVAQGHVPAMDVTVFDAAGKIAFQGPMSANGTFATHELQSGHYVVQFNTKSAASKNGQFLVVVSAGSKKVIAAAVPGEKFMAGGAAVRVQVGPNAKVTGQVANEQATARTDGAITRIIDGKRYLLVNGELGTNLGPHWVEESQFLGKNVHIWSQTELQKRMDRGGEGSMLARHGHIPEGPSGY